MDVNSTEEQVNARILANAQKAAGYDTLKAQQEQKDKDDKAAKVKAELDAAEKDKRIKADDRSKWQGLLEKDFDGTKAVLDSFVITSYSIHYTKLYDSLDMGARR